MPLESTPVKIEAVQQIDASFCEGIANPENLLKARDGIAELEELDEAFRQPGVWVLVGSRASNTDGPKSDTDLMFFPDDADGFKRIKTDNNVSGCIVPQKMLDDDSEYGAYGGFFAVRLLTPYSIIKDTSEDDNTLGRIVATPARFALPFLMFHRNNLLNRTDKSTREDEIKFSQMSAVAVDAALKCNPLFLKWWAKLFNSQGIEDIWDRITAQIRASFEINDMPQPTASKGLISPERRYRSRFPFDTESYLYPQQMKRLATTYSNRFWAAAGAARTMEDNSIEEITGLIGEAEGMSGLARSANIEAIQEDIARRAGSFMDSFQNIGAMLLRSEGLTLPAVDSLIFRYDDQHDQLKALEELLLERDVDTLYDGILERLAWLGRNTVGLVQALEYPAREKPTMYKHCIAYGPSKKYPWRGWVNQYYPRAADESGEPQEKVHVERLHTHEGPAMSRILRGKLPTRQLVGNRHLLLPTRPDPHDWAIHRSRLTDTDTTMNRRGDILSIPLGDIHAVDGEVEEGTMSIFFVLPGLRYSVEFPDDPAERLPRIIPHPSPQLPPRL